MSDDLVKSMEDDLRIGCSASIGDTQKAVAALKNQAAEITRLRAELDTARLQPTLNPDRWRGAINDALTNWLDTIREEDVPKDALRRLIQYEITAALDPAVSQSAADLVATARWDGMEQLERYFRDAAAGTPLGYEDHQRGASVYNWLMYCATTIATIRAAAKEVKP